MAGKELIYICLCCKSYLWCHLFMFCFNSHLSEHKTPINVAGRPSQPELPYDTAYLGRPFGPNSDVFTTAFTHGRSIVAFVCDFLTVMVGRWHVGQFADGSQISARTARLSESLVSVVGLPSGKNLDRKEPNPIPLPWTNPLPLFLSSRAAIAKTNARLQAAPSGSRRRPRRTRRSSLTGSACWFGAGGLLLHG